jgi:hypothetical protein
MGEPTARRSKKQRPNSFWLGAAQAFDLTGSLFLISRPKIQSDEEALRSDFEAVGGYLRMAMKKADRELSKPNG